VGGRDERSVEELLLNKL